MTRRPALFKVVPVRDRDRALLADLLTRQWGSTAIVSRGKTHQVDGYPGFIAQDLRSRTVGYVCYRLGRGRCEVVVLEAIVPQAGIGTRLLKAVLRVARSEGCKDVWLVTTNDNLDALRFYQRRGFCLHRVHRNYVDRVSRALKPSIPTIGSYGIPIRDELELRLDLCKP